MAPLTGLAARLRAWRVWFGLTQADAAVQAKVSLSTYSRWERGRPAPYREYQRMHALIDDWFQGQEREQGWALELVEQEAQRKRAASERAGSRRD